MRADSDNGIANTDALHAVAQDFGLKHVVYEGGPDNGGGSTTNVGSRILANRDPGMKDLIEHDMRDNWFGRGGDLYMYFALSGAAVIAPGSFVSIYGQNFTSLAYGWAWAIPDGKTLPSMVAGARVRINN